MIEVILNDELHHRLHFTKGIIIKTNIITPDISGMLPYLKVEIRCGRGCKIDCFYFGETKKGKLKIIEDSIDSLNNPLDVPRVISYQGGIYTICNVKSCEKID